MFAIALKQSENGHSNTSLWINHFTERERERIQSALCLLSTRYVLHSHEKCDRVIQVHERNEVGIAYVLESQVVSWCECSILASEDQIQHERTNTAATVCA